MKCVLSTNLISYKKNCYYLGQWALSEEDLIYNRKKFFFKFIWDNKKIILKDYSYIKFLCLKIIKNIYKDLNKVHNTKYSIKFWKHVLIIWIYHYVSSLYFRWRTVEKVNKSYIFILGKNYQCKVKPPDDAQTFFNNSVQNDLWNQKLIDEIVILLNKKYIYKKINKNFSEKKNFLMTKILISSLFPTFFFNFINSLIKYLPMKNLSLIRTCYNKYFYIKFPKFLLEQLYNKFISLLNDFFIKNSIEDTSIRNKFSKIFINNKFSKTTFENFLKKKIIEEIPKSYLENFKNFTNRCIHTRRSKIIISSFFLHDDNFEKFDVALKQEEKSKIYLLEHGGSLPVKKDVLDLDRIYLKKITWFRYSKEKNILQSKLNPIFFRFKENYLDSSKLLDKNLLIIGGGHYKWVYSCIFTPQATQRLTQLSCLNNFIKKLDNPIKKKIIFKPHPLFAKKREVGFDYSKFYKNIIDQQKISYHKVHRLFDRSKIIVCTYPETNFSEAMVTGIPTILFFKKKNYNFHKDTKKILNDLISCKILFTDSQLAASHINRIWKDPLEWFHLDKVKKVRNDFLNLALNRDVSMSNIQSRVVNFF